MARCSCRSHGSFLTAKGLEEAAQRFSLEGLAPWGVHAYLDRVGSVSALDEDEDLFAFCSDTHLNEQDRRFHYGS